MDDDNDDYEDDSYEEDDDYSDPPPPPPVSMNYGPPLTATLTPALSKEIQEYIYGTKNTIDWSKVTYSGSVDSEAVKKPDAITFKEMTFHKEALSKYFACGEIGCKSRVMVRRYSTGKPRCTEHNRLMEPSTNFHIMDVDSYYTFHPYDGATLLCPKTYLAT